ncbi:ribokinase [Listeria rocourtiae]|uniref:ribokinase n=1 Tax=Listeria rocourtiae TaxID=647910 RepID=UPI0016282A9C|nr:ribokinase [Listeria rocourtiae]MBC1604248.1 ribokinase [Listeria rocourtiae]
MKKITVIGSISKDFVVTTEQIPNQGETVVGKRFRTFFGGKGANQAIALSRAGMEVFMLGAVGDDALGTDLIHNLEYHHIDCEMVSTLKDVSSGSAHIQIMNGDNRIVIVPGANDLISISDVEAHYEKLKQMDMVVLQNEIPVETICAVIDFCVKNQIPVLYNPAPAKEIPESYIDKVSYLAPNEHEFNILFQNQELSEVLRRYPNKLIVTLGDRGAIFYDGKNEIMVPAGEIASIVDTTGAGDTFNGYLAKGIMDGGSIKQSVQLGNVAAGLAIQTEGAQDGIPTYEKVKALL